MQKQQNFPSLFFTSHLFVIIIKLLEREGSDTCICKRVSKVCPRVFQRPWKNVRLFLKRGDNEVKLNERDGRKIEGKEWNGNIYPSYLLFLRINAENCVCCVRGWRVSDVNLSYRRDDNDYYVGVVPNVIALSNFIEGQYESDKMKNVR